MTGAPTLNGTVGSLIGVLDACLVNGFGLVTLDSLVISGGIATATRAAGHSAEVGAVIAIAGATVTGGTVNGNQKVLSANATQFTFDATGISNQTATGTITAKLAAAGWTKLFSGTNLAAYKSADVATTGCVLRVDDTNTTVALVKAFETMSDINTGTGQFPTSGQIGTGLQWSKSSTANATANPWMLVADGRFFYFARAYRGGNNATQINDYELTVFGDFLPTKSSGDAYGCVISGPMSGQTGANVTDTSNYWYGQSGTASGLYCPRSYTALGSSLSMGKSYPTPNSQATPGCSGANSNGIPFPNPTDGGLYVVPHYLFEAPNGNSNNVLRGTSPGFYCTPQNIPNSMFAPRDTVTGVTGLVGKTLKALTCQSTTQGLVLFDITGPWR